MLNKPYLLTCNTFCLMYVIQDFNQCSSNPCVHGICEDLAGAFNCSCYVGYVGSRCHIRKDFAN